MFYVSILSHYLPVITFLKVFEIIANTVKSSVIAV